jgi:hypothetical protein
MRGLFYHSVDVGMNAALREALYANELNRVDCPACGMIHQVVTPLLYHDAERGFWLQVAGDPHAEFDHEELARRTRESFEKMLQLHAENSQPIRQNYILRVVYSLDALLEQVGMLEDGWDDHVIRVLKYMGGGQIGTCPVCQGKELSFYYVPRRWFREGAPSSKDILFEMICRHCSTEREWTITPEVYEEMRAVIRAMLCDLCPEGDLFISSMLCRRLAHALMNRLGGDSTE